MTDNIIKAAEDAGMDLHTAWGVSDAAARRFYAIAYRAGMERAAEICDSRAQMLMLPSTSNHAVLSAAAAIRAHVRTINMTAVSCTKSEGN